MRLEAKMSGRAFCVVLAVLGTLVAGHTRPLSAAESAFRIAPYIQNTSTDGVTILWETRRACASEIEYWEVNEVSGSRKKAADPAKVTIHKVRLTGLKPSSHYAYQASMGNERRGGFFTTAPGGSRAIRFAIFGDSRFWKEYWQESPLPEHLLARRPEFILHMGDLVNNGTRYEQWPEHFTRFESILRRIPMFAVRGNHEGDPAKDPENNWFGKYHEWPKGEPYSSFDWGNSHFALVSYTHFDESASFLDGDLGATEKKWKFAVFHYPVYCTGYASKDDKRKVSGNAKLEAVFDKHNVDMVFNGHTHIYERTFPIRGGKRDDRNGTVYLVQGGAVGGNYPDWWTATIARDLSLPHYTLVDVRDDAIELRSYGLAKGGQEKGKAARIVEIDHFIRWRDESLPKRALAALPNAKGTEAVKLIESLGAMCYGPAAGDLVGCLGSGDQATRNAAAIALERIANPAVSQRLLRFLGDSDMEIRRRVARTLEAAMAPEIAEEVAKEALNPARDSEVRERLLGALLHHAPTVAYPTALRAEKANVKSVRERAAAVLRTLRKQESDS